VVKRAKDSGVFRILNPGINLDTSIEAVQLANEYSIVYAAVGVHPNSSISWCSKAIEELHNLAYSKKVVAIGEIGLDYYRDIAPRKKQIDVLEKQLEIAAELDLPVVVHTRNSDLDDSSAIRDTIHILEQWIDCIPIEKQNQKKIYGVLHSFSGDISEAELAVELNFLIGITGPVTFTKAGLLRSVVHNLDIDHLLIETDAPFLTPMPFRGKRNEPAYVKYIAQKIAEIKQLSYDFVIEKTKMNSERIFNW
jgi:TatD DNase family protein